MSRLFSKFRQRPKAGPPDAQRPHGAWPPGEGPAHDPVANHRQHIARPAVPGATSDPVQGHHSPRQPQAPRANGGRQGGAAGHTPAQGQPNGRTVLRAPRQGAEAPIDPAHETVLDHHLVVGRDGALVEYDSRLHEPVDQEGYLTVHSVVKSFKKRMVVRGVSLGVRRGEAVGLLGPNGAGKTTVFYMITGLIPADRGGIAIDGLDVTQMPMYRRARLGIGYLPQETSIFRGLTVEQNIRAVLEIVEPDKKERTRQLDALLEEFHITHLRKSPAIALSGGERRRVEIARALASRPSYMLLDEPFAGIDPIAIKDIRSLVHHLTQRGIGVLITDHNVRETLSLIDRAYIIYDGHVLMEGNPDEIANNKQVRKLYLGEEFNL